MVMTLMEKGLFEPRAEHVSTQITTQQIVEAMCEVPQHQTRLDDEIYAQLSWLTNVWLQRSGEEATSEYHRYNAVQDRQLELPISILREHYADKTILVTGGSGLIGSQLIGELQAVGAGRIVSVSIDEGMGMPLKGVEYTLADIRDADAVSSIMQAVRPDIIFHVAADKYNHEAETRIKHTLSTNITGTKNVIEAAKAAGAKQIVYASTGKATRPYSPDVYASSKKTGEWLMCQAANSGDMLVSAARFTHVVDDSNVRRKIHESIDTGEPVRLQGPDVWFYVQSARESAQLLLNAGLEAERGKFSVQAIRDLELPVNLASLGLGAIAARRANVPVYFQGTLPGYEDKAWPFLYGLESGDHSPLINSLETATAMPSRTCAAIDRFELSIANTEDVRAAIEAVEAGYGPETSALELRQLNRDLGWKMLDARLESVDVTALRRVAGRIGRMTVSNSANIEHRLTDNYVLGALQRRESLSSQ